MGARSVQKNARLRSNAVIRERQSLRTKWTEGRVEDTNGMLERKEKEHHGEEGERGTGMPVKKWKD
jgi:hypothetical protein